MREILFKAKSAATGEWVEGSYVYRPKEVGDYRDLHYILVHDDYGFSWKEIDIDTICQYTGLTDKNGNKIWENDIVEVWWKQRTLENDVEPKSYTAVVEFGNPNSLYSWGWQLRFLEDFPFNVDILLWIDMEEAGAFCEVICNIFDNSELLKGE